MPRVAAPARGAAARESSAAREPSPPVAAPARGAGAGAAEVPAGGASFVAGVLRELARHLSGPNSAAILSATANAAGIRNDRIGPRNLPDLVARVEASFGFFGVPAAARAECLARLQALAGPTAGTVAAGVAEDITVPIAEEGDIVRARLAVKGLCRRLGFSEPGTARVIAAVSEVARNVFKHAGKGTLTARQVQGKMPGLEVIATDSGPGIVDVGALLAPQSTTRTGPGAGLRGARDQVDTFEVVSQVGTGTTVTLRKLRGW